MKFNTKYFIKFILAKKKSLLLFFMLLLPCALYVFIYDIISHSLTLSLSLSLKCEYEFHVNCTARIWRGEREWASGFVSQLKNVYNMRWAAVEVVWMFIYCQKFFLYLRYIHSIHCIFRLNVKLIIITSTLSCTFQELFWKLYEVFWIY